MVGLLRFIGWASIVAGIACGIFYGLRQDPLYDYLNVEEGFRVTVALYWWLSGAVAGIVFLALAYILEYLEEIRAHMFSQQSAPSSLSRAAAASHPETGKSKATLDSVKDYKFKHMD
ncbi:hypothetical protein [Paenibacillus soyae]|uniref:Uncharacterized protein n=1 Tax=Paenibacillus soyae TaxID=2969249 RepID=A0A9X2MSD6_9BACL|nr:hypothetical protein [Paenibacillus soyae]MCR2805319.1 hypothetical protein [Paenibacillus soyae]